MNLTNLNDMQRAAVERTEGPLLILAGAGSGKTSTVTSRIAHILELGLAKPHEILAITFTNKAAGEMRERVEKLAGAGASGMQLSTFHSFCCRVLREHITELGYTRWFTIYDDEDSLSVISDISKEMDLSDKYYPRRAIRSAISDAKNKLLSPEDYKRQSDDARADKIAVVFTKYEERLKSSNALDFDDLLNKVLELFAERTEILRYYQHRFKYIHVDEYQDTNRAQYLLVKMLGEYWRNVCVVGDDDQSIYGWRGADIRNILDFEKDFPDAFVVRLEQNYRSTTRVLDAANAVISHNEARKPKRLWTERQGGEKLTVYTAETERDEAAFCARTVMQMLGDYRYGDIAVLYRTNAQSRALEEALMKSAIPYSVYGGVQIGRAHV
jgi:DNA helicase-2/ATP-dependent DNA helicase PcrA